MILILLHTQRNTAALHERQAKGKLMALQTKQKCVNSKENIINKSANYLTVKSKIEVFESEFERIICHF